MIYRIPDSRIDKLEKQCKRISNKGALVIFNIEKPCEIKAQNNPNVSVPGHEVEVEGSYVINGWEFVATIQHTPNGNIVRCINSDSEKNIPEKYKTCGPECEHCHRIRDRKDTYLIYNMDTKEWKQVGRTCLKDYTGGLDAELCAQVASFFTICEDSEYFEDDFSYGYDSNKYINAKEFKKYAYPLVKNHGYKKESTVEEALDAMFGRGDYYNGKKEPQKATDEDLKPIDEYADSISDNSYGYLRNAKIAWEQEILEYRDLALVASFISSYFKNLNELSRQKEKSETTKYVGNVGDKIEIEIASYRILYQNQIEVAWHTYAYSYTYEIIDKEGNTFIWKASSPIDRLEIDGDFEHIKPLKLKGTIKGHSEYRGTKQTVLTRCKVTDYSLLREEKRTNMEAFKELNSFLDELDN